MQNKTENLSFQEAAELALANGYLFTRSKYKGSALFHRPGLTAKAADLKKFTSLPELVKDVINTSGADAKVEFSPYLCSLMVSEGGGWVVNQTVILEGYDVYASDWMVITDSNFTKHVMPNL
jgi:hypothetical protein